MASPSSHPSPSPNALTFEGGATNASDGHHVHGSRPSTPQYATYRTPMSTPDKEGDLNGIGEFPAQHTEGKAGTWGEDNGTSHAAFQSWVPIPLRPWFWIPLVCVMIGGGIGLEVAFHFSEKNRGWETNGKSTTEQGFMHYVYTFPPAAIALLFAGFWAWTDIEIRRLQPYVDLARGNSPPQRSLLLDYTRNHTLYVWSIAAKNHHFLVTLSSLLALATFCFQPLSAALFNVQDVFWTAPRTSTNSLVAPGLNQNENFQDLTAFLTAAGYASANVLYNIGDPIFVERQYTVAPFQLPDIENGTITTNTTIIESKPNCVGPDGQVNMMQLNDGVWNNSASFSGCTFEWSVNRSAEHLFGANPVPTTPSTNCTQYNSIPLQFRPVVFWFFTYVPTPAASVTLCAPSIALHDATVSLSVPSNHTAVKASSISPSGTFTSPQLVQFAGNVTGEPLDGRAYNGLFFPFADAGDPFVAGRQQAVQLALPGAVFQAAQQSPGGLGGAFQANAFAGLAQSVYTTYLTLIARTVYFLPLSSSPISLQADLTTPHLRLFLSPVATHLLAALLFTLGIGGTLLQLAHRRERAVLHLASAPGTIASAVSMGLGRGAGNGGEGGSGDGGLGSVLAGRLGDDEIRAALRDKRFRIDPVSMRIVVEGEAGYETAQSPRKMEFFQGKRFSLSHLLRRDGQ